MFVWFCNDMIIASARLKVFNDFATRPCKRCACVDEDVRMIGMKGKKNLPQVLFYVLKSCEKSTKCPYRFVLKSWFVMCSLAMFYFEDITQPFFAATPT